MKINGWMMVILLGQCLNFSVKNIHVQIFMRLSKEKQNEC